MDAKPCGAPALRDGEYCIAHEPEREVEMQQARAAGARKSNRLRALRGRRTKLDTMPDLVQFTAKVIYDTAEGNLEFSVARAILYGVSIQRQLVEASDFDQRIKAIEERLNRAAPPITRIG